MNPQENDDMKMGQLAAAAAVAVGVLAGCQPAPHPEYKRNPHPTERYEITVTLVNPPGAFNAVQGHAIYEAPNCFYMAAPSVGAGFSHPNGAREIEYVKTAENVWKGVFYADGMIDEDYGMKGGLCHWQLLSAGVSLWATGAKGETKYGVSLDDEQIRGEQRETTYFSKMGYPRDKVILDYPEVGQTDRAWFGPSVADDSLFTVTLTARKLAQ